MKLAQSLKMGAGLLIFLNLLMSFGAIGIFMRMAPAIEGIISRNQVSLEAVEEMLSALVARGEQKAELQFRKALQRARHNVTEEHEPVALADITASYEAAFAGDAAAVQRTLSALSSLGSINREAMRRADLKAQQLGYAGAWGIVFMASVIFLVGMIFLRSMKKNLAEPLEEIDTVIRAFRNGEVMRRCVQKSPVRDIRRILGNINELLDIFNAQQKR